MGTDYLDVLDERARIQSIRALSKSPWFGEDGDRWADRLIKTGAT